MLDKWFPLNDARLTACGDAAAELPTTADGVVPVRNIICIGDVKKGGCWGDYMCVYVYMYVCMYVCMYVYIYIERER